MDKKVFNKEDFKNLVINEAKKIMKEESESDVESKVSFEDVESLIKEMESASNSISSLNQELLESSSEAEDKNLFDDRNVDMDSYNKKKNIMHVNEGEKDKWDRMLKYEIPKDEER